MVFDSPKIDFGKNKNFELVHADALTYTPPEGPYKIVANIPYYITSPAQSLFSRLFLGGIRQSALYLWSKKSWKKLFIA